MIGVTNIDFKYGTVMVNLIASVFVGNGSLWLYLDNELIIKDSDSVVMELSDDIEYIIHWYVRGEPGTSFTITISSPREGEFHLTKVIGKGEKDAGNFSFRAK